VAAQLLSMDNSIDIRYYLSVLRRRWLFFAAPAIVTFAIAVGTAVVWPPTYVSTARILIESQQIPEDFVRPLGKSQASERIQVVQQLVMTRANLLTLARKYKLMDTVLRGWSSTQVVEYLRKRTIVEQVVLPNRRRSGRQTIAFTVSFENRSSVLAVRIANDLMTLILDEDINSRAGRAKDTTSFLDRESKRLEKELLGIEKNIANYKNKHRESLPERLAFLLNEISNLRELLNKHEQAQQNAFEKISLTQLQLKSPSGARGEENPLLSQLEKLKMELVETSTTYSKSHPRHRSLERRIEALERRISEDSGQQAQDTSKTGGKAGSMSRLSSEIVILKRRQNNLAAAKKRVGKKIKEINKLVAQIPQVELGLKILSRHYETTQVKLAEILRKLSDANLGKRLEEDRKGERFRVIEQPTKATEPTKPNRWRILALGLVLAFGVGGASMTLSEMMDKSIRSASEMAAKLNIVPFVILPLFVTPEEVRARRLRAWWITLAWLVSLTGVVIAIHLFYMPLDVLALKLMARFNLTWLRF